MKKTKPQSAPPKEDPTTQLNSLIVARMLSAFQPASADDPLAERYTSEDFLDKMAPTFQITKNELSRLLFQRGFELIYEGGLWVWLMKEKDREKM